MLVTMLAGELPWDAPSDRSVTIIRLVARVVVLRTLLKTRGIIESVQ